MFKLSILNVTCTHTGGSSKNADDVMVIVQADAGPPVSCPIFGSVSMIYPDKAKKNPDAVTSWQPTGSNGASPVFYFNDVITLNLYDRDGAFNVFDAADFLCGDWFDGSAMGSISRNLSGAANGALYSLDVEIEACGNVPAPAGEFPNDTLYDQIQSALTDFKNSNALYNTILETTDPKDMKDVLEDAIVAGAFTELAEAILSNEKVQAVSFGLMGQVDLFGGVTGSFGIAFDRSDFSLIGAAGDPPTTTIFGGAGFVEGVDAGIECTLALGLWFEPSQSIGGIYLGAEVDADDTSGFTIAAFADRDNSDEFRAKDSNGNDTPQLNPEKMDLAKMVFIGLDVGIDDGIEADEAYFFAGQLPQTQCYQTGTFNHIAVFNQVFCDNTKAPSSNDNVGFRATIDSSEDVYQYPFLNTFEMDDDTNNTLNPAFAVKFDASVSVDLYAKNDDAWSNLVATGYWSASKGSTTFNQDVLANQVFSDASGSGDTEYHLRAKLVK